MRPACTLRKCLRKGDGVCHRSVLVASASPSPARNLCLLLTEAAVEEKARRLMAMERANILGRQRSHIGVMTEVLHTQQFAYFALSAV